MNPSPAATRLSLIDQIRREWYVSKVDFLAQDVPGGYRKGMRRELRADLAAAAAQIGMSQAVEDLGPAAALAQEYKRAEGRVLPHWWTGVIVFAIVFYFWVGTLLSMAYGMSEAAQQLAGDRTVTVEAQWLGSTVSITEGADLSSAGVEFSFSTIVVMVILPLVAARAWRYRPAWLQRRLAAQSGR